MRWSFHVVDSNMNTREEGGHNKFRADFTLHLQEALNRHRSIDTIGTRNNGLWDRRELTNCRTFSYVCFFVVCQRVNISTSRLPFLPFCNSDRICRWFLFVLAPFRQSTMEYNIAEAENTEKKQHRRIKLVSTHWDTVSTCFGCEKINRNFIHGFLIVLSRH